MNRIALLCCCVLTPGLVFGQPESDEIHHHNLAFGVGPHGCLGSQLARAEANALLTTLCPHLSRLELRGPAVRLRSNFMNGIKSLPARFAPA